MTTEKVVVTTEVGPREMAAGVTYVHDIELEDGEELRAGQRAEILDGGGNYHAAVVDERVGSRWRRSARSLRTGYRSTRTHRRPDVHGDPGRRGDRFSSGHGH